MECNDCFRLERMFLESLVAADRAETALRCFFITHQKVAGVSDMDEYRALRNEQERFAVERHRGFQALMDHRSQHQS